MSGSSFSLIGSEQSVASLALYLHVPGIRMKTVAGRRLLFYVGSETAGTALLLLCSRCVCISLQLITKGGAKVLPQSDTGETGVNLS